jgi:hypothetical protein
MQRIAMVTADNGGEVAMHVPEDDPPDTAGVGGTRSGMTIRGITASIRVTMRRLSRQG